jgi:general secretion pathway protein G
MASSHEGAVRESGVTLLELLITISIVMILASVAMPLSKMVGKRTHELELRQELRRVRAAIDQFKTDWNREGENLIGSLCLKNRLTCKDVSGLSGYPKSVEVLLQVELTGEQATISEKFIRRYLRKIPIDPITSNADWRFRCYGDPVDSESWCGQDVYDLSSRSDAIALDGTKFREW